MKEKVVVDVNDPQTFQTKIKKTVVLTRSVPGPALSNNLASIFADLLFEQEGLELLSIQIGNQTFSIEEEILIALGYGKSKGELETVPIVKKQPEGRTLMGPTPENYPGGILSTKTVDERELEDLIQKADTIF